MDVGLKEKNYHQIETCANCKYVFNQGIYEEVLECEKHKIGESGVYPPVEHDYVCDSYKKED